MTHVIALEAGKSSQGTLAYSFTVERVAKYSNSDTKQVIGSNANYAPRPTQTIMPDI